MANKQLKFNAIASGDINEYRFVKVGTDNTIKSVAQATAGAAIFGVAQYRQDDGKPIAPSIVGVGDLIIGGTVSAGNRLKSDANGKGVATDGAGQEYGAIALIDGVSEDRIPVIIVTGQTQA
jgi:hypothetical protein